MVKGKVLAEGLLFLPGADRKALDDRSFSYTAAHRAPTVAGTPAEAGRYGIATGTGWGRFVQRWTGARFRSRS